VKSCRQKVAVDLEFTYTRSSNVYLHFKSRFENLRGRAEDKAFGWKGRVEAMTQSFRSMASVVTWLPVIAADPKNVAQPEAPSGELTKGGEGLGAPPASAVRAAAAALPVAAPGSAPALPVAAPGAAPTLPADSPATAPPAAAASLPAAVQQQQGRKKRQREACLSPRSTGTILESEGRTKRDRKQTEFFQDAEDGGPAVNPPGAESPAVAWWPKLFDTPMPNPLDPTQQTSSHVVQMVGTRHAFYLGCPVLVRDDAAGAGLVRAIVSGILDEGTGKVGVKLVADGRELQVVTDAVGTRVRFDREACGVAAIGRHAQVSPPNRKKSPLAPACAPLTVQRGEAGRGWCAARYRRPGARVVKSGAPLQVRFDDGTWFVGVISSVEQKATGDGGVKLQLRVQFEDGDAGRLILFTPIVNHKADQRVA